MKLSQLLHDLTAIRQRLAVSGDDPDPDVLGFSSDTGSFDNGEAFNEMALERVQLDSFEAGGEKHAFVAVEWRVL